MVFLSSSPVCGHRYKSKCVSWYRRTVS